MVHSEERKGILALVSLTAVFATYGIFARYFSSGFALFQQVYLRAISAFLIGFIIFNKDLNYSKIKKISLKEWGLLLLRSVSLYLLGIAFVTKAFILSKYGVVSIISILPFVALLGVILFKEKMTFVKTFLILSSFCGAFLIVIKDYNHLFSWGLGEILALIATFFFALNYVGQKWQSQLLNEKEITQIILIISFVLTVIVSLLSGEGIPNVNFNWTLLIAVILVGLFNVIGLYLANYGFERVKVMTANNILNLEVLFAITIGFIFYHEVLAFKEFVGGTIIILSVLWMNKLEGN